MLEARALMEFERESERATWEVMEDARADDKASTRDDVAGVPATSVEANTSIRIELEIEELRAESI
jgi:hypothetical protein